MTFDVRFGSRLRQVRFFCCALTTVGSVFTQPRPKADIPRGNLLGGTPLLHGASLGGLALITGTRHRV